MIKPWLRVILWCVLVAIVAGLAVYLGVVR
jgi:hypothetical protein